MEEEKKEIKEKKGTDFITLVCFAIIIVVTFGALLGFISRKNSIELKEKENTQIQDDIARNNETDDNSEEIFDGYDDDYTYVDKEYVMKIINDYNPAKINYYEFSKVGSDSYEEYLVTENHYNVICVFSNGSSIKVFSIENGELKEHLSKSLTDKTIGRVDIYELEEKSNGSINVYFEANQGDGLCYESSSLYRLDYDNKLVPVASYSCDNEEEERKRSLLGKDESNIKISDGKDIKYYIGEKEVTEKEYDDYKDKIELEIYNAHTLEYYVGENKVTEEEYDEFKKKINDENILLFKTDDRIEFFKNSEEANNKTYKDMPFVFTKEKFDYEYTLVLPYVNLSSNDVQTINKEIKDIYEDEKSRTKTEEFLGLSYYYTIDSETNILCAEIIRGAGVGESALDTTRFYIDIETGKKLTNKEFLSKYDIDDKNIKQLSDKVIENYYNYYLKYLNDNNFDSISFEDFSKRLKVYNKKTEQKESYNYLNINDYEMDFDKDEKSFLIEKMSYEADGKTENIDGIWMWYHL